MGWVSFSIVLVALLGVLVVSAAIEDIRHREIANWKNAAMALAAVPFWWSIGLPLWPDVAVQIGMAAATLFVFGGAFAMGWMGGGDVKMIVALALWLPPGVFLAMLVVMSIAGGALTAAMMLHKIVAGKSGAIEVPYGVAIAAAALISLREPILNQLL